MPQTQKKPKTNKKNEAEEKNIGNRSNIVANSIMTSKMVHIRKKKLKKNKGKAENVVYSQFSYQVANSSFSLWKNPCRTH